MKKLTILCLIVGSVAVGGAFRFASSRSAASDKHPDFGAQIETVGRMRAVVLHIRLYDEQHSRPPASLDELCNELGCSGELIRDGWERPFYYYASMDSYILISFGKDGMPDVQSSPPGGFTEERTYESDIVWLHDAWAQSPLDVDRN